MKSDNQGGAEPGASASPTVHLKLVMILVTGALFMEILDGTIIATALPAMARTFGTSAVALNVGVSAYLLALGVFIPASGWVADRYGARRVFGVAIALFTLTSALCGASSGMAMFVTLRILQGIAGAMMVPVGRLVVMRYTPKDQLMSAMAALIWPALVAPVLGPPIGGFITTHFGWRWIFYLNVPLGLAALIAAWFVIPDARGDANRRFDVLGFVLCGAGTFASLTGLERIDAGVDAWSVGLLVGGVALIAAAIVHLRRTDVPLMDLKSFSIPTFRASIRGGSISRMAIGSAPFLLPLMFQVGFGYDAFHSGLLLLAVFAGNLGMKSVTTPMLKRFGFRPIMIWNGALCALMLAACALLQPSTPTVLTIVILVIGGMTRSMQFTVLSSLAFADVPKPQMSHANGLFNTVSQVAMAAGITLGAMAVRLGHFSITHLGFTSPGAEYRFAFLLVAVFSLLGLIDAVKLPRGAADHFVARSA